jgi:hypothetical protein
MVAAATAESGKASARVASEKGKVTKEQKKEKPTMRRTEESMLQTLETSVDLAVSHMPDAKFCIVPLVVRLPEIS